MKNADFDLLVESVKEGGKILRGEAKPAQVTTYPDPDVRAIRKDLGKSQEEFARMIGVSLDMVRSGEQGKRLPEGPARALLKVAANNPKAFTEALAN